MSAKKYYKLGGSASSFTDFTQPTEEEKSLHLGEVKSLTQTKFMNSVLKAGGLLPATEEEFLTFEKQKKENKSVDDAEAEKQVRERTSKTLEEAKKLRRDAEAIGADNMKLKGQVDDMSETIDELREDKVKLNEKVTQLEADVKTAAETAGNQLQGTINELKGNIDSAVDQNTKLSNELKALTEERDALVKEVAELKSKKKQS